MLSDIIGYRYELYYGYEYSDDEIKVLENQVKAFKSVLKAFKADNSVLKALKSINYIYG
jgi:hypothetical protein